MQSLRNVLHGVAVARLPPSEPVCFASPAVSPLAPFLSSATLTLRIMNTPCPINSPRGLLLLAVACAGLTAGKAAAFTPFVDGFPGGALNSANWSTYTVDANGSVSVGGDLLTLGTTSSAASHRATVFSTRSDFNPFEQALTVNLAGITLSGTAGGTSRNTFYVMVGNTNGTTTSAPTGASLQPNAAPVSGNGYAALLIQKHPDDSFRLIVRNRNSDAENNLSQIVYTLSEIPATLSWSISGTFWSLDITGASLSHAQQGSNLTSVSGTFTRIGESSFNNGSWLALGAINESAVITGTSVSLDMVSVIPEPGGVATWIGASALLMAGFRPRRRR